MSEPIPTIGKMLLAAAAVLVLLAGLLLGVRFADARDLDSRHADSPNKEWYSTQHNSVGQWCCDESDGHDYEGYYTVDKEGNVTIEWQGKPYRIDAWKVLNGPNPTGHAVWWYLIPEDAHGMPSTYCFAPGILG